MKKTKATVWIPLLTLFLFSWGFCSCSESEENSFSGEEDLPVKVRIGWEVSPMQGESDPGNAPSGVDENSVFNLRILEFRDGKFIGSYFTETSGNNTVEVSLLSGRVNLYAVANVPESTFTALHPDEESFKDMTLQVEGSALFSAPTALRYIPMSGQLEQVDLRAGDSLKQYVLPLTRLLARVDAAYTSEGLSGVQIREIQACNVLRTLPLHPSQSEPFPLSPAKTDFFDADPLEATNAGGTWTFYLPANRRGTGGNVTTQPTLKTGLEQATYLAIRGFLTTAGEAGKNVVLRLYPGDNDYNDYNLKENTYYALSCKIDASYASDGRVSMEDRRSNSYLLAPGGTVSIPVGRANQSALGTQLAQVTASGWTPVVVWQSAGNLLGVEASAYDRNGGLFTVRSRGGEGNAVVGIRDASGNLLWSWHIWITGYDPDTGNLSLNNHTWMDRNLGALSDSVGAASYGLFYQWGRKDPFPASVTLEKSAEPYLYSQTGMTRITREQVGRSDNLRYSIRFPLTFYFSAGLPYDWYTNTGGMGKSTLWGETKTVYDPCPYGWKVPPGGATGAWYTPMTFSTENFGWINADYGRTFVQAGDYYPASGFRNRSDGELGSTGEGGYYWSSTAYGVSYSNCLTFSRVNLYPANYSNRAYGFNIRCIKE
ncbi:MAG: DUF4906 domain-containing protein [Bacteroides sp.]|nr:DUF4906 domain-containing protein [Bacteroides sp.]